MIASLVSILALVVGYFLGYTSKGVSVNVNVTHPPKEKQKEGYNESLVDLIPQAVRQELDELNKGVTY